MVNTRSEMVEEETSSRGVKEVSTWRLLYMGPAIIAGISLQLMILPCMCPIGAAKMQSALILDGLILIRFVGARVFRERNRGWVFYVILCVTSPLWIELAFWVVGIRH